MEQPQPPEEGLADGIFGTHEYAASLPQKKDFLPWHKPRKQFVRHYQWCEQIQALIADVSPEGDTLRYLGLPGVDLLDLRYFHNAICQPRALRLRFLGFNSGAAPGSDEQTDLNVSLDEVTKLPQVDPGSEIIQDDFCRVANSDSIAWRKAVDLGPYDVINLDLCDGFGKHTPGTLEDTHYNAVNRLLTLQARKKNPWLLLLTTRVGNGHIHAEVLQRILNRYLSNLVECAPFQAASQEAFAIGDEAALRAAAGTASGLLPVFLVGLCKWLVGLAVGQQPPSKVEVKSVLGYRVNQGAEHEDLVSLAIKFEPTFVAGPDGLSLAHQVAPRPSECDLSVKALRRVASRKDADAILAADQTTFRAMAEATADLLELARYDVDAYRAWAGLPT